MKWQDITNLICNIMHVESQVQIWFQKFLRTKKTISVFCLFLFLWNQSFALRCFAPAGLNVHRAACITLSIVNEDLICSLLKIQFHITPEFCTYLSVAVKEDQMISRSRNDIHLLGLTFLRCLLRRNAALPLMVPAVWVWLRLRTGWPVPSMWVSLKV